MFWLHFLGLKLSSVEFKSVLCPQGLDSKLSYVQKHEYQINDFELCCKGQILPWWSKLHENGTCRCWWDPFDIETPIYENYDFLWVFLGHRIVFNSTHPTNLESNCTMSRSGMEDCPMSTKISKTVLCPWNKQTGFNHLTKNK